jgi:hypothetical protein
MNNYKFTTTWFADVAEKTWEELFNLYPKKPKKLLEIGCFEGMATTWLCSNILEDGAEYDVIDTFGGSLEESGMNLDNDISYIENNFKHNISNHPNIKFNIHKGYSQKILPTFPLVETYDFIYISYGSKKNLFTKDILNSFTGSPIIFLDNSIYQITPNFLLFFYSEAKILCITIDIYNESEKVQQTFDTLLDYYKNENMENNNNNKIDVIFYDIYYSKRSNIIEITTYFKSLFIEKEIKNKIFYFVILLNLKIQMHWKQIFKMKYLY